MEYVGKTDWELQDTVMPVDMNRIEQGIIDADAELANVPINAFTEVVGDLYTGDLDSIKAGVTSCADTATNLPLAEAGKCICINSGNYDTQLYIPRSGNYIYSRNNNGSVWTTWVRLANKSDLDLKANKSIIALEFSASTPYSYGNRCIYNEVVYKYTNATTTTGAWNASYWTAEPVGTSLKDIQKTAFTVTPPYQYTGDIQTLGAGVYSVNRTAGNVPFNYEDGILTVKAYGTTHKELSYFVPSTNEVYTKSYHVTFGWSIWNCASSPLRGVKQALYPINNKSCAVGQTYLIADLNAALIASGGAGGTVVGTDVRITSSTNSAFIKAFFRFEAGLLIELAAADTISADVNIFYI